MRVQVSTYYVLEAGRGGRERGGQFWLNCVRVIWSARTMGAMVMVVVVNRLKAWQQLPAAPIQKSLSEIAPPTPSSRVKTNNCFSPFFPFAHFCIRTSKIEEEEERENAHLLHCVPFTSPTTYTVRTSASASSPSLPTYLQGFILIPSRFWERFFFVFFFLKINTSVACQSPASTFSTQNPIPFMTKSPSFSSSSASSHSSPCRRKRRGSQYRCS